ncbi:uncharacterized protein LOC143547700 isoform X1 [Bidens hawaiensis]|uniref:uncharacterized protein LOC143547700 isoform X1 n=1 Tax=Bidens hawaiensis TaxID=980011 RepID=UPI0040494423
MLDHLLHDLYKATQGQVPTFLYSHECFVVHATSHLHIWKGTQSLMNSSSGHSKSLIFTNICISAWAWGNNKILGRGNRKCIFTFQSLCTIILTFQTQDKMIIKMQSIWLLVLLIRYAMIWSWIAIWLF